MSKEKYFISERNAITSKRGVLGPHDEVTAELLGHSNNKTLDDFVDRGKLYKGTVSAPEAKLIAEKAKAERKKAPAKTGTKAPVSKKTPQPPAPPASNGGASNGNASNGDASNGDSE